MSKKIACLLLSITLLMVSSGIVLAACGSNQAPTTNAQGSATHSTTKDASSPATPAVASSVIKPPQAAQEAAKSENTPAVAGKSSSTSPLASASSSVPTQASNAVQNCGRVETSPLHRVQDAGLTQQAGACFWQAYQQCRAATLMFQPLGVDTVTRHTFLIEKTAAGCTVTDSVSHAIVPRPATVANYTCAGVMNTNGALRFTSCGAEGDIIVPLF